MLQRIAVLLAVSTLAALLVACPSGGAASGDPLSWLSPEHQARTTDALNRAQALARLSFAATAPSAGNDVQAADSAWPRPGSTTRASVPWHGGQSDLFAGFGGISSDGRVAVWESNATDSSFVPDDTNGKKDVFARDLPSKQTVRASVASDGAQADLGSSDPAVSGDGRYVVFASAATNLVPGDPGNGPADNLFIHDLATRTTERVSISTETGEPPNDPAFDPGVSHDGRYVVFQSYASNLVEKDTNLYPDIYVIDRATGSLEVVSVDSTGAVKDGGALYHSISPDGRYVAFSSFAALVPNDANARQDVFVHDRQTGETELVSISTDGVAGDRDSRTPSISEGGRYVAFGSLASTLVPQDANNAWDIFVRDRALGTTRRVSVRSSGAEAQSGGTPFAPGSFFPSISPDGRFVAYQSDAPNLMPNDTADWDVFVHDLVTGSTTPVAHGTDGLQPDKGAGSPDIGPDGRFVGLSSNSTNLVPEGNDQWHDVFVHDRGPSAGIGELSAEVVGAQVNAEGWATFSGDRLASAPDPADDAGAPGLVIGSG